MQEAYAGSANRDLVQMRINGVAHTLKIGITNDSTEHTSRAIVQMQTFADSLSISLTAAKSRLSRANLYMRTLLHATLPLQETEFYLVRREFGKE
jgi:hypothetical protein